MSSGPEEGSQEITRVKQLAEEIMHLNLLEIADLTEILQKRLGLDASQMQFGQPGGGEQNWLQTFSRKMCFGCRLFWRQSKKQA